MDIVPKIEHLHDRLRILGWDRLGLGLTVRLDHSALGQRDYSAVGLWLTLRVTLR